MVKKQIRDGELGPRPFFFPGKDKDAMAKRKGIKQSHVKKGTRPGKKPLPEPPKKDDEILEEEAKDPADTVAASDGIEPSPPQEEPEAPAVEAEKPKPQRTPVAGITMPARPKVGVSINRPKPPAPAAKRVVIEDDFAHDVAYRFSFVGAGQGGGRMADAFYRLGYRRVGIFNTTDTDFEGITPEIPKCHLDVGGARKDPAFAQANLKGREEEVRDLLHRSWGGTTEYGIVCMGLGGGTGSGTGPMLVDICKQHMVDSGKKPKVGALVSLPRASEGQTESRNAVRALDELLAMNVSPLVIVDNQRIHELFQVGIGRLYDTANTIIAQLFNLFNQLAAVHSEIQTFDRNEFGELLDGGICVFGCGDIAQVENPADVSQAIKQQLEGSVLAEVDLNQAKLASCLFVADEETLDTLSTDFFDAGWTMVDRMLCGGSGTVHRGVYYGNEPGLQAYTMLSCLPPPRERITALARKGGVKKTNGGLADFLNVG